MMHRPYTTYAPPLPAQQPSSRTAMPTYSTSSLPPRTQVPQAQQQQQQQQTASAGGASYMRQTSAFSFGNAGSLGNGMGLRTGESVHDAAQLDLNDFPALGAVSTPGPHQSSASASAQQSAIQGQTLRDGLSSYASQAQAQLHSSAGNPSATGPAGNGLNRDFTNPDDFPALGGSTVGQTNGYGGQISSGSGPISILRNNAFGGDDKRVYGLKQATPTPSSWAQAQAHQQQQQQQHQPHPPNGISQSQTQAQQQQVPGAQAGQDNASALDPTSTTNANQLVQPHTPADQVLHSAADRWGLLALVRALRQQTDDALSSGQDLGLLGMELDNPGSLYPKFATPWASYLTTTPQTEPNYHLPSCYNVAPPPPNPKKAAQFSDETLFFSFYAMPRDAAQEVAAQELYNRNWRYHKVQRIWITTDLTSSANSSQQPNPNNGSNNAASLSNLNLGMSADGSSLCTVWDVDTWERQTRMMRIDVRDLENRDAAGANNVAAAGSGGLTTMGSGGNVGPMGVGQGSAVGAVGDRSQGQGLGLGQQSLSGQGHAQAQAQAYQQQQQQQLRV